MKDTKHLTEVEQIMYDMGYGDALNGDDPDPYYEGNAFYMEGYEDGEYWTR